MKMDDLFYLVIVTFILNELYAAAHEIAAWLVRRQAAKAQPPLAERLEEEWLAELEHRPSHLSKLWFAAGLITREAELIEAFKSWHSAPPVAPLELRERAALATTKTRRALDEASMALALMRERIEKAIAAPDTSSVELGELAEAGVEVSHAFIAAQADLLAAHESGLCSTEEAAMALVTCRNAGEAMPCMADTLSRLRL